MLTSEQISNARTICKYECPEEAYHEHDDCVRVAYEWLDAQRTSTTPGKHEVELKRIIERWAGRYVSQADVELAAHLHPRISGSYPGFNLDDRLTLPCESRLRAISEAMTQGYRKRHDPAIYAIREEIFT